VLLPCVVDRPDDAGIDETLRQTSAVEARVRANLRDGEARAVTSVAGLKFTEMEPLYGDQFGQVVVALNPASDDIRAIDEIIEGMRADVEGTPGRAEVSFLTLSGGPPQRRAVIGNRLRANFSRCCKKAARQTKP
jgi:hypothetical protein